MVKSDACTEAALAPSSQLASCATVGVQGRPVAVIGFVMVVTGSLRLESGILPRHVPRAPLALDMV